MNIMNSSQPILPIQFDLLDCKSHQFYGSNNDICMILPDEKEGLGTDLGLLFLNPNKTEVKVKAIFRNFLPEEIVEIKEITINRNYVTCVPFTQIEGVRKINITLEQSPCSEESSDQNITLIFPNSIESKSSKYEIPEEPFFDKELEDRLRNMDALDSPVQESLIDIGDETAMAKSRNAADLGQDPVVKAYLDSLMESTPIDDFPNTPVLFFNEENDKTVSPFGLSLSTIKETQKEEKDSLEFDYEEFFKAEHEAHIISMDSLDLTSLNWTTITMVPKDPLKVALKRFFSETGKEEIKDSPQKKIKTDPEDFKEPALEVSPEHLDVAFDRFFSEVNNK